MTSAVFTTSPSTISPTTAPSSSPSTTTTAAATTTTTTEVDYGDEIPLNFMDVNFSFAIVCMIGQLIAAVVGTFGNLLVLVAVGTNRHLRSVESVFIVNLALCDLYITMFAQPLSVVAKLIGWRSFEGVPGVCFSIGCMCTVACVGSCLTLTVMSLNRYVLICHHQLYHKIFTYRNSIGMCLFILFFSMLLITLNFSGIGNHSFDYKSYECIWDRMATHDFTIFFSIVLVWMPMTVSGVAYARTYWFVFKVRRTVGKSLSGGGGGGSASKSKTSKVAKPTDSTTVSREGSGIRLVDDSKGQADGAPGDRDGTVSVKAWVGATEIDSDDDDINASDCSQDSQMMNESASTNTLILDQDNSKTVMTSSPPLHPSSNSQEDPASYDDGCSNGAGGGSNIRAKNGNGVVALNQLAPPPQRGLPQARSAPNMTNQTVHSAASTSPRHKSPAAKTAAAAEKEPTAPSAPATHPGMKLARPLFIIYVAFTTCWLPYSLGVSADRYNNFPSEVHAFITAFAHGNSSVNWLVYYMTHNKMRCAFQNLLRCQRNQPSSSSVQPIVTKASKMESNA